MPIDILMPALSPTMTEGNLATWKKKEGDKVKPGDVIAEIETDKATMEVEAVDEGIIGKILVPAGTEGVKVNSLIAVLLEEGEDASAIKASAAPAAPAPKAEVKPEAPVAPAASSAPAAPMPKTSTGGKVFASPLAKRIAGQKGIDLSGIVGTGPHGRIIRADVEEAKPGAGGGRASAPSFAGRGRATPETTEIPLSNMRKVIAKRLLESKQTVPHFYLSVDCTLDALLAAREKINATAPKDKDGKPAFKLSVNDMVIKASAMALKEIPAANASWGETVQIQYNNIDISVAVATPGGLITPIIRNADQKGLAEISLEMKDLAVRARDNKLKPEEFQGGGFSISNLGMYGVKHFAAIINPPQSCILAVGAGEERVVVEKGQFKAVQQMTVTLSVDHRVVDGAVGAEFLGAFKRYIEEPVLMLV